MFPDVGRQRVGISRTAFNFIHDILTADFNVRPAALLYRQCLVRETAQDDWLPNDWLSPHILSVREIMPIAKKKCYF